MRIWYLLVAPFLLLAGIAAAPIAASDCTSADGMTLCSMDDEDGNLQMPTLPSPATGNNSGSGLPGYSDGPGSTDNRYVDPGCEWFQAG